MLGPMSRVYFQCQRCANCCRWPGDVKISKKEVESIAAFLSLSVPDFIEQYTRVRRDRQGLSLIEKPNHECIFLEGIDCQIQEVKPEQCRGFPNTWNFPGWRQVCEAIPLTVESDPAQGKGD